MPAVYALAALLALAWYFQPSKKPTKSTTKSKEKQSLADDFDDALVHKPVRAYDPKRDRDILLNQPRISVSRPGYDNPNINAENAPPNYWLNSEAHKNQDGSLTFVSGGVPLHEIAAQTQPYYAEGEPPRGLKRKY